MIQQIKITYYLAIEKYFESLQCANNIRYRNDNLYVGSGHIDQLDRIYFMLRKFCRLPYCCSHDTHAENYNELEKITKGKLENGDILLEEFDGFLGSALKENHIMYHYTVFDNPILIDKDRANKSIYIKYNSQILSDDYGDGFKDEIEGGIRKYMPEYKPQKSKNHNL